MEIVKTNNKVINGVIPEGWEIKTLGDVVDKIIGGGTPSRSNRLYWGKEIPWATVKDFATFNPYYTQEYITKAGLDNSASNLVPKNTLITSTRMGLGKAVIYKVDVSINQDLKALIPSKCITTEYLYHWFKKSSDVIEKLGNGSTVMGVSLNELKGIQFIKPPLKEQTAIATALSDTDALISSLEKLIAKKRAIKKGAMEELLKPKEGWNVMRLGDAIIDFQNGYAFSAEGYVSDGVPIVSMANIGLDGSFNFNEAKCNKWTTSQFDLLKSFHLNDGDLIIAMTDVTPDKNLIGRMAIVNTHQTMLLNQRVGHLRLNKQTVNPYFLKSLSNMRSWRSYCVGSASLGVQANLGTKDILNGLISLPKISEQDDIAKFLSDMDSEISALESKLSKYRQIKTGMMQSLLTGKIRLV